ncbi:MAG TPA: RNA polymerase sigma factor [Kofleriaceae bacterium]|jgi:RNA polymerase sigma-70 factor (ECF subfamily)
MVMHHDSALPIPPELTDSELVARVVGGAREDFATLVRRHNQRLYRAARAVLRDDHEAEDVLQQGWLAVFEKLSTFRGDAAFSTWATRIVVNSAITLARKRPPIAEVRDDRATGDTAPDDAAARAQLGVLLERCVSQIPQGNREVLVLRDVLELDTAETAACLGLTEEAVRVRLHRARAAVAEQLGEQLVRTTGDFYAFLGGRCEAMTARVMMAIENL